MEITPEVALNRLLEIVQFRSRKRRKLFETECDELCQSFLKNQDYLISEIDTLARLADEFTPLANKVMQNNDLEPVFREIAIRANELNSSINERRHKSRAERLKIHSLALERRNNDYFKGDVINYLTDDERAAISDFFSKVVDYYSREERDHSHDLAGAVRDFQFFLDQIPDPDSVLTFSEKKMFVESFDGMHERMKHHRERAQLAYSEISTLLDRVRVALTI